MKRFMVLFMVLSNTCPAQWSKQSLKELESLNGRVEYQYPDYISLWGGVRRYIKSGRLKGEDFEVVHASFEKKLPLYFYRTAKKAPLVIFFPGIFGDHNGTVSPWILNTFENSNFHVGSVPNFLNKKYIGAKPKYNAENALTFDAKAALIAVTEIIKKIGVENVESVSFLGESLGTFVAASSVQFSKEFPEVFKLLKNVVLMWPPLNLKGALNAFDKKIRLSKAVYEDCSYILSAPAFIKHFIWQDSPLGISKENAACFGAYLYHGAFLKSVEKSYEVISNQRAKEGIVEEPAPKNFQDFLNSYNSFYLESMKKFPDKLELKHWLGKWKARDVDVKIVSSVDDFINKEKSWDSIENKFLLDWGEHCAPISLDEWPKILRRETI